MVRKALKVTFLGGIVLLFALCGLGDEELLTFVVADFEDCMVPSMYVEQWGAFTDGASGKASVTCLTDPVSPERGEVIRIDYRVPFGYSFSGFYMKWECPNFDPNEWEYVTFYVRGDPSSFTRRIKVEVKIRGWGWKVCYFDSVTTEWQKVVLPLKDFKWPGPNPAGWWKTNEFVITFEHGRVTRWRGTIYIDTVGFAKHIPPGAQPPTADFSFSPERPTVREEVRFTDGSTDPDGEIVSWHWDFGDGATSTEKNPAHRYTRKGTFTVKLTVTDDNGLTATKEAKIEVVNVPPKASFTFEPEEPYVDQEVSFDASGSEDPDGKIVKYSWDFGDGEVGEGIEVKHLFEKPGSYTVTLTVTDDDGAKATVEKEIVVKEREEVFVAKEVWGLIIGISGYKAEGLDLDCARADAEAMYEWLMGTGVPKDHVRLLVDKEATLVNVRQGLDWLMKNAEEDDLVIFYFSGHGYQGMDLKPKDEKDGWDEYFVVHDTDRDSIEGTALRDDEFGQFLDEIASEHVLVIFDSCYSGGLPKGQRGLPPRGKPKGPLDFFNDFDPKGKLVLAASAEDQLSWEDRSLGHGVFTHFLLEGLKGKADANGDYKVTAEELYEYVHREVPKYVRKKFHADQEPQLLGKGDPRVEVGAKDRPPEAAFSWEPEAPYALGEVRFLDASSDDHGIVSWEWDFGDGRTSSERDPVHVYGEEGSYRVVLVVMDTAGQKARVEQELEVGPPGEVTAVDEEQGLVTISLGTRQGVKVGDRFQVFAYIPVPQGTLLKEVHGAIDVVYLAGPDRAVCRIVEELFPIKVKDKVRPIGGR